MANPPSFCSRVMVQEVSQTFGFQPSLAELVRKSHGKASGMGGSQQFLRVRSFSMLEPAME